MAELAKMIDTIEQDRQGGVVVPNTIDLRQEVCLDAEITGAGIPFKPCGSPKTAFLTGATGFLGAHLLAELLKQTQATIYCLVRASSLDEGRRKLQANLAVYSLWEQQLCSRIIPVIADLSQPCFGLSEREFARLGTEIDSIYHCAAWVNFTYPYEALKAINVLGTQEVLRLACRIHIKLVHFVSTLSVFPARAGAAQPIGEVVPPDQPVGLVNGYAESKWVAEKLLWAAAARGLPVAIYRPGLIGGDSRNGQGNPRDLIWHLIKGCVQIGSAPQMDLSIDLAPVDYVSRAIVHLSLQAGAAGKAFHLFNPRQLAWNQLVAELQRFGYRLRHIAYEQWRAELDQAVAAKPDHALLPFLSLFPRQTGPAVEHDDQPDFDARNTLAGLAGTTIACPALDSGLMAIYLSRLVANGFLEAPDPHYREA